MKIAVSGYVGPITTGVGRTLINIISRCSRSVNNNKYYLFCNYDNKDFDIICKKPGIIRKTYNISRKSPLLNLFWHQIIYQLRLLWEHYDVSYIPNATLLLWKVCPTVIVIHDLIEYNVPKKFNHLRMLYRKVAYPLSARKADCIITVSQNSKKDIVKYCKVPQEKVKVIYNGIDYNFKPLDKSKTKSILERYSVDYSYILYVGTIDHPGKNSVSLIKAFKILLKKYSHFKLVLIGTPGFGFEYIKKEILNLGIKNKVVFPGYVNDEDLVGFYNGATVFALLSLYEGFGLPLIEAMACGTPVIAANTSCLSEIVGNAGFLVDPYDINKIAEKIEILISKEEIRHKMIQKGYEQANKFSWEKAAEQTLQVFNATYSKYYQMSKSL